MGCPTATNIVMQADGGLARVHLVAGRVTSRQSRRLAELADQLGNGIIEITNRGNVQLRGITAGAELSLRDQLVDAGLVPGPDGDPWAGTTVIAATAGLDPHESPDVLPIASDIASALGSIRREWLAQKFAVLIDGGRSGLMHRPFDLTVGVGQESTDVCLVSLGTPLRGEPGRRSPVAVPRARVAAFVSNLAQACADDGQRRGQPGRVAAFVDRLDEQELWHVIAAADPEVHVDGPGLIVDRPHFSQVLRSGPVGTFVQRDPNLVYISAIAPLGRLTASQLRGLATLAEKSDDEMRFTSWRSVLLPHVPEARADVVVRQLERLGLHCDPAHPAANVVACSGSTGCNAGLGDVQAHAHELILRQVGSAPWAPDAVVHLSGCEKRCAHREAATITLVAVASDRYDVWRRGQCVELAVSSRQALAFAAASGNDSTVEKT